ncbi:proline-rich protein 36-like [Amphibalanus amphitrite]|uniref:proline-rich protein 36-like n=1 Tax=Amphibalanus amphitrite TaxID=1232801 RepID=UPI001C91C2BA|nr:proline-rich protein 36-like [Amphibalanus amphitrite]
MEIAVRNFVGDVSRFLDASLSADGWGSSCEARCRYQLQQLRTQLQLLVVRYPILGPAGTGADDATYDDTASADLEYDDAGGQGETIQEAYYDDTGGGDGGDTYDLPSEAQEEYDELGPAAVPAAQDSAERAEAYLPMGGKAARMLGLPEGQPAPSVSLEAPAPDPEVVSIQSQTSQESSAAEQVPAARVSSSARRWGRLQLRQEAKLWLSSNYKAFWAGLTEGWLYLYRNETDAAQKRSICLSGYEVRQPPPGAEVDAKKRPLCFELVKPGGKTHQLLALTPKDARQWMAALELEGVRAGKSEREPAAEPAQRLAPPAPGPDPMLSAAAVSAAAAATVALKRQQQSHSPPVSPVEEDLYYEPEQGHEAVEEDEIYEDISWPSAGRPQATDAALPTGGPAVEVEEDEIYDTVGSPSGMPPEPDWLAPVLPPPPLRSTLGRTRALPALPSETTAAPRSPPPPPLPDRAPLAPPGQPPPPPPPGQPPPPPPQRDGRGRAGSVPAVPTLPPQLPPPPLPQRVPDTARVPSPAADVIEEELYDELGDTSVHPALAPPSDPFYNVLESEYLQPPCHPSPLPVKTPEEAPDEGYGNSSGGSENDCHPPQESHYKTLPKQVRPFRPPGTTTPETPTVENGNTQPPQPPSTTTDGPTRPTKLPLGSRPRAGTAGAVSGSGSVADVIRRLNRQSTGDDEPAPSAGRPGPRPTNIPVSAELARKQALIAGGVRALSPVGRPAAPPAKPAGSPAKPAVLAPKPTAAAGKPKPKPALPVRQDARSAGYGRTGAGGESRPGPGLVPNKSGVYKTLQRMSDSESRPAGRPAQGADGIHAAPSSPEEDEVYAEIDDDSWRT